MDIDSILSRINVDECKNVKGTRAQLRRSLKLLAHGEGKDNHLATLLYKELMSLSVVDTTFDVRPIFSKTSKDGEETLIKDPFYLGFSKLVALKIRKKVASEVERLKVLTYENCNNVNEIPKHLIKIFNHDGLDLELGEDWKKDWDDEKKDHLSQ